MLCCGLQSAACRQDAAVAASFACGVKTFDPSWVLTRFGRFKPQFFQVWAFFPFCAPGGGEDEAGVAGPGSAAVFGARRPAGVLLPAPRRPAPRLHLQVGPADLRVFRLDPRRT